MDPSADDNAPDSIKPAQEVEETMSTDGEAADGSNEPQILGRPGELIEQIKQLVEENEKTKEDVLKSLAFKQRAELLKLKLQKLKEKMLESEALAVLFEVINSDTSKTDDMYTD